MLEHGRAKARRKGADLIAVNAVGAGRGFGTESNEVTILDGTGEIGPNGVRFRGSAKAAPGSEDALNNLLNIIGRRNGALSAISIG